MQLLNAAYQYIAIPVPIYITAGLAAGLLWSVFCNKYVVYRQRI
ncbi:hypothetical protein [Mucilaginibacter pineti]|nr:hypothetical protein [Mucilaginibacter pineti]